MKMLKLSERSIFIHKDINLLLSDILRTGNYSKCCIIVDENTAADCLPLIKEKIPNSFIIQIASGEENKTLATCQFIWEQMTTNQMDRKGLVINLGGGVIGDMGGFCASTYKRGIDFIQIPTTLLSQVDASVGGKLGIDFNSFKNHIGVFKEPKAVLINIDFLQTLDPRELRSGFAEIIKHCLIADKTMWEELKTKPLDAHDIDELVEHSVSIKAKITDDDPNEKGLRKILNFGHTIGHAIESFFLHTDNKLLHGEAIAIGMIAEAFVAQSKGFISLEECDDIKDCIINIFGKASILEEDYEGIIPLTFQDKKNENNVVFASLLEEVGKANFNIELTKKDIIEGLNYYND